MIFLNILKIVGIVIGGLILFIIAAVAIILSSPIFYKGKITYDKEKDIDINIKVCHIFRLVYGYLYYKNDNLDYYFRLLWEKVDDDEDPNVRAKKKAKKRRKKQRKRMKAAKKQQKQLSNTGETKSGPAKILQQEPVLNESTNKNSKKGNKNKKSIFKRIESIYNGIKQKIIYYIKNLKGILAQVNDRENREAVVYALKMIKQPVSFLLNEKLKVRMKLGTDDPANTGEILGIAYAAAALLGVDLVIEPDFENKIFELDAGFKGHVSVYKVIIWVLELYSNDKIKVVVDDVL